MCWLTKIEENIHPKVAEEDIKTFKICKTGYAPDVVHSYYKVKEYTIGFTYRLNCKIEPWTARQDAGDKRFILSEIEYGFHSYNPNKVKLLVNHDLQTVRICLIKNTTDSFSLNPLDYFSLTPDLLRVECIIPKGTTYYENEKGEMVSESIKIESASCVGKQQENQTDGQE